MEQDNSKSNATGIGAIIALTWFGLRHWSWLSIIACLFALGMLFSHDIQRRVVAIFVLFIHIFVYAIYPRLIDDDYRKLNFSSAPTEKMEYPSAPADEKEYPSAPADEKEYAFYFAPYTLVIDNGLDTDVELAVNNKKQHVEKKSHIIFSEKEKELLITWNGKNYNFSVDAEKQYVFNIDKKNDYEVFRRTYGRLLTPPDSTLKTIKNELFFEFEADYIDFWFKIPNSIEVPYYKSFGNVHKNALVRVDYEKRKLQREKWEKEMGIYPFGKAAESLKKMKEVWEKREANPPPFQKRKRQWRNDEIFKSFEEWNREQNQKKTEDSMENETADSVENTVVAGDSIL
ncbi:MAG: hypothetical protein LBF04_06310 [Prevotellaceae bacterium]|jgi:hypothetical protein|nr:hypothetical protein [Prevotellaceae bacterium]